MRRTPLVHEELSYIMRGILFEVHNELGQFRNEKQYGDCLTSKLSARKIPHVREKVLQPSFEGEFKGRNRIDFLIDDKIIIELKVAPGFSRDTYNQCQRYLVSTDKKLLLLVNFYHKTLIIKRILNPKYKPIQSNP